MMSKKILLPVFAFALVTGMLFAVPSANAEETTPVAVHRGFFGGIIDFITQKFGLNKEQVQSAVEEYKAQNKPSIQPRPTMSAEAVQEREKSRLDKLVKDGKITSDQEQAILNELASVRSKYNFDAMKDKTPEERRSQMKAMQDELKAWAESQGIDSSYVMSFGGMGREKGVPGGFHGDRGQK